VICLDQTSDWQLVILKGDRIFDGSVSSFQNNKNVSMQVDYNT